MYIRILLTSFVLLTVACQSFGAIVFSNIITDANPSLANPFTVGQLVDSNITASGIGRGPGIAAASATNRYNASGWNAAALDTNRYFTFTMTPNTGSKINFIDFVYTSQASGTGPTSFAFRSSLDNFAADIIAPTAGGNTVNLSGASFQDISSAITFRLYGWGASSAAGTFSVNDFAFNGSVIAVPEPTSLALVGIVVFGAVAVGVRRRANKSQV